MATLETDDPGVRTPAVPIDTTAPFPGLRSFEPEEAEIFFGREDDIFELLDRLRCVRFLALVGASGCGKSSLMRAGLIAALRDGFMVDQEQPWRIAIMRPGSEPIANLARALAVPGALDVGADAGEPPSKDPGDVQVLQATLRRGPLGLVEAVREADLPAGSRLLVLVDQFEEIFRLDTQGAGSCDEARALIKLLLGAALQRDLPIYVALTMRSEFLGDCAAFTGLPEAINEGLYLLPQMGRDPLRDAIVQPLALYKASTTPQLRDILLNEAGDAPDRLPVLQHAMMRMWDAAGRRPRMFDLRDYKAIGRLDGALSQHIEEVFDALDERQQRIAEVVFRCVTDTRENNQTVRWPDRLDHIHARAAKVTGEPGLPLKDLILVIEEFRRQDRSFLMPPPPQPLEPGTVIDISHEALIRQWARLRSWAEDEAVSRALHRQIREAAARWRDSGRDPYQLFGGKLLIEAQAWLREHPEELKPEDEEFIEASLEAHERAVLQQPLQDLAQRVLEAGAGRSDAIERKVAQLFAIYARQDAPFAQRLRQAFEDTEGVRWVDADVFLGDEVLEHARSAIEQADVVLFLISHASSASTWTLAKLNSALESHKRIVPVLIHDVKEGRIPASLRSRNIVDFRNWQNFEDRFDTLVRTVNSDLPRAQLHARLLVRATEWRSAGQPDGLLLRGDDLNRAETWLMGEELEPKPTQLQREYVLASRKGVNRRTLFRVIGGATGILLLGLVAVLGTASASRKQDLAKAKQYSLDLLVQRNNANAAREVADSMRGEAELAKQEAIRASLQADSARDEATRQRAQALAALAQLRQQERVTREALETVQEQRRQVQLALRVSTTRTNSDGSLVALALPSGGIQLIDAQSARVLATREDIDDVTATEFSWSSRDLAIGKKNGTIVIWRELPDGSIQSLGQHDGTVRQMVFDRLDRFLATSGDDNTVHVWDVLSGRLILSVPHNAPIAKMSFTHEGSQLSTISTDGVTRTTLILRNGKGSGNRRM